MPGIACVSTSAASETPNDVTGGSSSWEETAILEDGYDSSTSTSFPAYVTPHPKVARAGGAQLKPTLKRVTMHVNMDKKTGIAKWAEMMDPKSAASLKIKRMYTIIGDLPVASKSEKGLVSPVFKVSRMTLSMDEYRQMAHSIMAVTRTKKQPTEQTAVKYLQQILCYLGMRPRARAANENGRTFVFDPDGWNRLAVKFVPGGNPSRGKPDIVFD